MAKKPQFLLFFLLLWVPHLLFATNLHVIELQNYPADEFLETINPILLKEDRATVSGNKIILRADQSTIDIINSLATELDKPLRNLMILVKNSGDDQTDGHAYSIAGQWGDDKLRISNQPGYQNKNNHTTINITRGSYNRDRSGQQQVRAVEGEPAFIATGEALPLIHKQQYFDRYGRLIQNTNTEFRDVVRGFYVTARLTGKDRVHIRIRYTNDHISENGRAIIDTNRLSTSISGYIDEWIPLGSTSESQFQTSHGLLENQQRNFSNSGHYSIKVIPLD